jgi:superfamily II DNA or RNA helicase
MFELRDYQTDAINSLRRSFSAGNRRIVLHAPTGAGKTVIAAQIVKGAVEKRRQVMFLAHRRELVNQAADKLVQFGVDHGILMSGEIPYGATDVQVASIDTLRARCINTDKLPLPHADIIVIDECHRSLAPTYLKLIALYPDALVLGLSATPIRSDGKGLGHVYEDICHTQSIKQLIGQGWLVQPRSFAPTRADMTGVPMSGGDYNEREMQLAMDQRTLVGDVTTHWHRLASDRPTIVFAYSVKNSIHLKDEFRKAGVEAAHVDGETPLKEREEIITDLRQRKIQVICNYMVLTEGFDEPSLSACVVNRPTRHLGAYIQMAGRPLRPFDNKEDSLIIDHGGNIYEHGWVDDEHNWILEEGKALTTTSADRQKDMDEREPITCVKCATVYSGQLICPHCGYKPEKRGRWIESRDADLVEMRRESRRTLKARKFTPEQREQWYRSFLAIARDKKYKRGWAFHKYQKKFDERPDRWFSNKPLDEPIPEAASWVRGMNIRAAKAREKEREQEQQNA